MRDATPSTGNFDATPNLRHGSRAKAAASDAERLRNLMQEAESTLRRASELSSAPRSPRRETELSLLQKGMLAISGLSLILSIALGALLMQTRAELAAINPALQSVRDREKESWLLVTEVLQKITALPAQQQAQCNGTPADLTTKSSTIVRPR